MSLMLLNISQGSFAEDLLSCAILGGGACLPRDRLSLRYFGEFF